MLTDNSPMPYGKHKDIPMVNVPAYYLLWLYDNNKCSNSVREYIVASMDALKKEVKKTK